MNHDNLHLSDVNDKNETLLHIAAKHGNVTSIKHLIKTGSDVNAQNSLGKTPIMLVIKKKPHNYLHVIEILHQAGADIYISDNHGISAAQLFNDDSHFSYDYVLKLYLKTIYRKCLNDCEITAKTLISLRYSLWQAVVLGNVKVIEHMIMKGSLVNNCSPDEPYTALSKAVEYMDLEIVNILIKYGADVDLRDGEKYLPIFRYGRYTPGSIQQPEIIKILLHKSLLLKDMHQEYIIHELKTAFECGNKEVIQMLIQHCNNIFNLRDMQGQTVLHYLSRNHHSDITDVLQGRQIDVNVCDDGNRTPLFIATQHSRSHINTYKFLLESGADVNVTTIIELDLETPLFSLCQNFSITKELYFEIIEIFLKHHLNIQFVGLNGVTVFDIILDTNSFYMAEPLLAHLAILEEQGNLVTDYIRFKINFNEKLKSYFELCKIEIEKMKSNIINGNLTLYMILANQIGIDKIVKSYRLNPDSLSIFEKLKREFYSINYYSVIVQKRISFIISKLQLLQKAAFVLCKILKLKNNPSHLVVSEIINYLNGQDLYNLNQI